MTWKFKVQRAAFALTIVAALAMATGANWFTDLCAYFDWAW